jgi:hypothetical protein
MVKGNKVQRIIEKYDLEHLGDEMVNRWTDPGNPASLHQLERYMNQQIVQSIIKKQTNGMIPQEYPPEQIAYLLQAEGSSASRFEDVSQIEITEIKSWFEKNNINTDELTKDLVTYNTIYQYLKNIKGVSASDSQRETQTPEERQQKVENRLSNLHQRTEAVIKQGFESLVNTKVIPKSYEIHLQFRVECTACDRRQSLLKYIRNQGCSMCDAHNRSEK